MVVWGRARYLSVTEAPHNTEYLRVGREKTFVSLKPKYRSGGRTRDLRLSKLVIWLFGNEHAFQG